MTEEEIKTVLDTGKVVEAVEEAFRAYGEGRVNMPPKAYLDLPKGDFRAMYGEIRGLNGRSICGLKWVNVHPENPRKGLPTVMAKILLNDSETAIELADMDGSHITDMRTGAAGAVAAKYLSRKDASNVAIIGAGRQAKTQLECLLQVRDIEHVKVYDISRKKAEKFAKEMADKYGIGNCIASSLEKAVKDADILTTVTPSRTPIVSKEIIPDGVHINAIGADARGKEELDPEILKKAKIVIDDWSQASHSGEINVPLEKKIISKEDIHASLGDIVVGRKKGRSSDEEITVFDSTGLIIQDLVAAYTAYRLCKERGIGSEKHFLTRIPPERLEGIYNKF